MSQSHKERPCLKQNRSLRVTVRLLSGSLALLFFEILETNSLWADSSLPLERILGAACALSISVGFVFRWLVSCSPDYPLKLAKEAFPEVTWTS